MAAKKRNANFAARDLAVAMGRGRPVRVVCDGKRSYFGEVVRIEREPSLVDAAAKRKGPDISKSTLIVTIATATQREVVRVQDVVDVRSK
jgi:hypothetical protein